MGSSSFSLGFVTLGRSLDDFTLDSGRKYEICENDHETYESNRHNKIFVFARKSITYLVITTGFFRVNSQEPQSRGWRYFREKCFCMSPLRGTRKPLMSLMFSDHFDLSSDINFE